MEWFELMERPAHSVMWRHGVNEIRQFDKLADAITHRQEGIREGTHHIEKIVADDDSVWNCE